MSNFSSLQVSLQPQDKINPNPNSTPLFENLLIRHKKTYMIFELVNRKYRGLGDIAEIPVSAMLQKSS